MWGYLHCRKPPYGQRVLLCISHDMRRMHIRQLAMIPSTAENQRKTVAADVTGHQWSPMVTFLKPQWLRIPVGNEIEIFEICDATVIPNFFLLFIPLHSSECADATWTSWANTLRRLAPKRAAICGISWISWFLQWYQRYGTSICAYLCL